MKLKQLKSTDKNLLNYIKFFDEIPDTTAYWNELIYLYGNRTLTTAIEELYTVDGLDSIGVIFDLRSITWLESERLDKLIRQALNADTTVTHSKSDTSKIVKNMTNENSTNDTDYVVPYDTEDETKSDKSTIVNSLLTDETIDNTGSGETVTTYSGFNRDKLNYIKGIINNYPDIRYMIYKDIVNVLCLQVYDYVI